MKSQTETWKEGSGGEEGRGELVTLDSLLSVCSQGEAEGWEVVEWRVRGESEQGVTYHIRSKWKGGNRRRIGLGNLMRQGGKHWQITRQLWVGYLTLREPLWPTLPCRFGVLGGISVVFPQIWIGRKKTHEMTWKDFERIQTSHFCLWSQFRREWSELKTLSLTTAAPPSRALSSSDRFKFTSEPYTFPMTIMMMICWSPLYWYKKIKVKWLAWKSKFINPALAFVFSKHRPSTHQSCHELARSVLLALLCAKKRQEE